MFSDNNIHTVPFPGLGVKALNKMPSLQSLHDGMDESNYYQEDEIPLLDDSNARKGRGTDKGIYDVKGWDVFRALPPGTERSGSVRCWEITTQILKIVMYFITFVVVLGCAVTSKGSLLFMTSQIKLNRNINLCKADNGKSSDSTTTATINTSVTISWIWGIFFAFCMSEIFTFFACLRQVLFKRIMTPRPSIFFMVLLMETLHTVGVCLFLYEVLPSLDAVRGAMLTNCLCFIPACLNLLSRPRSESHRFIKTVVDILAIMAQANGFILIPLVQPVNKPWAIPLSLILTSIGWWENYVDRNSAFPFIQSIALYKDDLKKSRYKTYMFVSLWKCVVMFGAMIGFLAMDMPNVGELFPSKNPFGPQSFNVKKITNITGTIGEVPSIQKTHGYESLIVCSVQIISSFICYYAGKFACRICIQGFSFAFPLNLVMPVTVSLLIALCGLKAEDSCFFTSIIPDYIYWECFRGDVIKNLVAQEHAWVWLLWLFSQTWITLHIWSPKCERLAKTEKLFVLPMYHGLFIDQSMVLNRRRDDEAEVRTEDIDLNKQEGIVPEDVSAFYETISVDTEASSKESKIHKHPDTLTKIYCCATMWHETTSEMQQMLKSVMRMDEDQSARRNAQQYLRVVDPDYYEFEVHIFFDDAFEISDENEDENQVNDFVKQLINVMDTAASAVHQCNIRLRPPKKVPTPYGGRLIWILPGKNKLTAHLKDKSKIRHRKRWSQVMYMYYLLGNRLMELPIDVNRKEVLAENTFILTLDGDIDFRPHAVQLLVDLMKKNHNLGATCGRIHPIGSGPMVWYQKFEYAIGHWLQKATEHMIGCVLCSPGCFSLFRAKALMDDNCMRRYTLKSEEARHYVQFDQGEDRWLCTLLLQRGYRVEYCAASDAYTHAPEGFVEFYNQRRRWVPSTIANIMDLLMDYKTTIKVNDNISFGYILYQMALMLGTLLGPGTIFLMIVGACVAAFRISNWTSFMGNIAPILLFMIICFLCKAEIQLIFAQILSAGYAMLMMAVIVGTTLQMNEDGTGSPSAIFMFTLIGSFLIAALLHPQEFFCIVHGLLYFLSIPSMYLLLMIYSLCNLNNVTWGTREVQTKKTREELQEEKKREEELKKAQRANLLFGLLGNKNTEEKNDGFLSFGCGNLFRCLLCVDSRKDGDRAELIRINAGIEELGKKIEKLENKLRPPPDEWENHAHKIHPREKIREQMRSEPIENHYEELPNERHHSRDFDDLKSIRDDLINPFWIEDKALRRGEVEYLPPMEIQFWKDLIAKYLHPLDENKEHKARIAKDLKDLRNKCTFGFFMFNGLFILIVFLLQLNKDTLHIDWPFGAKINTTFNEETGAIDHQEITPLHLEPIGLVFVVFFMLILVIQFIAMIFHRFGTLSHILATTELSCFKSKITDFGDNAFIEKNAVEIARNLQALRGLDDDYHVLDYDFSPNGVALRRTIHHLEKYGKGKPKTGTLDVAFKKRFFALTAENGPIEANTPVRLRRNLTLRAETIRAIERRRNTVFGNKANRMETLGANGHVPGMKTGKGRRRLDSVFQPDSDGFQGYHNETYDRAGSESNLINNDGINMKTVASSPHPADSWEQNDLNENITNSVL